MTATQGEVHRLTSEKTTREQKLTLKTHKKNGDTTQKCLKCGVARIQRIASREARICQQNKVEGKKGTTCSSSLSTVSKLEICHMYETD